MPPQGRYLFRSILCSFLVPALSVACSADPSEVDLSNLGGSADGPSLTPGFETLVPTGQPVVRELSLRSYRTSVFLMNLTEGDRVQARLSGAHSPRAELHAGSDYFVSPDELACRNEADEEIDCGRHAEVNITWTAPYSGLHLLALSSANRAPEAAYELEYVCLEGTCYDPAIEDLTDEQASEVLSSLDDQCPDTFCAGDFSFYLTDGAGSLSCADGDCTVGFSVKPAFGQFDPELLERDDYPIEQSESNHTARLVGAETLAVGGWHPQVIVQGQCELSGGFDMVSDVWNAQYTYRRHADYIYDRLIECIDTIESMLSPFPLECESDDCPQTIDELTDEQAIEILSELHEDCSGTFCEGDIDYYLSEDAGGLECEVGSCTVTMHVRPHFDTTFSDEILEPGAADSEVAVGNHTARIVGARRADFAGTDGEVFAEAECVLRGPFNTLDDIYVSGWSAPEDPYTDNLWSNLIECADAVHGLASALPQVDLDE